MRELIRRMPWGKEDVSQLEPLLVREWLVTNGLGGYASGTVAGVVTQLSRAADRRACPPAGTSCSSGPSFGTNSPGRRSGRSFSGEEGARPLEIHGDRLVEFRLDRGLPVWRYQVDGIVLEKSVLLVHQQNTVHVTYRLLEGRLCASEVLPSVHFPLSRGAGEYASTHDFNSTRRRTATTYRPDRSSRSCVCNTADAPAFTLSRRPSAFSIGSR